jgi:pyruvate kinase
MRRTKIIATVGPASDSDRVLDALLASGTDVVRLNFSHGTHATHAATFDKVRAAARRTGRDVAILQDLSGPKIRTGRLEGGQAIDLKIGDTLSIGTGSFVGGPGRVSTTYGPLAASVHRGDRLLLADGTIALRVESSDGAEIRTSVVDGGRLGEHKGISAPGVALPAEAITPKDIEDLKFGIALGVDMVAVSFVQRANDVLHARALASEAGSPELPIVAKIERPQALDDLDAILAASDAVMVARGDLGLEMPLEQVPRAQKQVTFAARAMGVPVIVATQVLESMTTEPRPTRAEVSDAANAVADGVDGIMLAGETAIGTFPARTVQTLDAILREAESSPLSVPRVVPPRIDHEHAQALCEAAVTLAERSGAEAIVAVTYGGRTARRLSALRPGPTVVAATPAAEAARRLALLWGLAPIAVTLAEDGEDPGALIGHALVAGGFIAPGASFVYVSINPDLDQPASNYVRIRRQP